MPIDQVDPDEIPGSRRRWIPWAVAAAVVGAVAAAFAMAGSDDSAPVTADSAPVETVVGTEPAPTAPPVGTVVFGFPDRGSDYTGPKLPTLIKRTTADGIDLHLQSFNGGPLLMAPGGDAWEDSALSSGMEPPSSNAGGGAGIAIPAAPIQGNIPELPKWCVPSDSFRLSVHYQEAISVINGSLYAEPFKGLRAEMYSGGLAEGHPFRVLLVQTATDATSATVRFSDGATDRADVSNGRVVLATPGASNGRFTLSIQGPAGSTTYNWAQLPADGSPELVTSCAPPPPPLPAPGSEQPADVAEAERLVTAQFDGLFAPGGDFSVKQPFLDDSTGVADALNRLAEGGFAEAASSAVSKMNGLVFTSATEAWFRYDLFANGTVFNNRFGTAHLIDGVWKISRATLCQDLALAGAMCEPMAFPLTPPQGTIVSDE